MIDENKLLQVLQEKWNKLIVPYRSELYEVMIMEAIEELKKEKNMKTELILTEEEIDRIANKLYEKINRDRDLNVGILKHGLIREFDGMDLWFEAITDTKDGFVLRDSSNEEILGLFPEQDTK